MKDPPSYVGQKTYLKHTVLFLCSLPSCFAPTAHGPNLAGRSQEPQQQMPLADSPEGAAPAKPW